MTMVPIVHVAINPEHFLHTNAIDFTNVTNGSPMETLVILITVLYKHVIQQTSFTALIKQQHVYHKLHPDHHS